MGKFIIDTLNKEDVISAMDMLYRLCKDKYCCREEFDSLKDENESLQKENTNLKDEIEKIKDDLIHIQHDMESTQNTKNKLIEEYNRLKEEKQKIEQESKAYKNRLSEININSSDSVDKVFYQVSGTNLEQTTNNKAPYIVIKNEFFFNDDSPHQKAIQNKEKMLIPFCEIISSIPDANYVKTDSNGKCKILEGNEWQMEVVEKAKISLIHR